LIHDDLIFYKETADTYGTGAFVVGSSSFTGSAAASPIQQQLVFEPRVQQQQPVLQQQQPVFEAPVQQQSLFQTPASDEAYYRGETPPLEFLLADLLGGTANEIGDTQLSGAPPVTQPTQKQHRAMMEDFHDSAQRAGEALETAASVEAEVQVASSSVATPQAPTGAGAGTSGSATPQAATEAGAGTSGSATPQAPTGGGLSHRAQVLP
jgi:hypothetical protein